MHTHGEMRDPDRGFRPLTARACVLLTAEVAALAIGWQLYRFGRYAARDQVSEAFDNADRVTSFERGLGLDLELGIQRLAVVWDPVIEALNRYYVYAHFVVIVVALLAAFVLDRPSYRRVRRVLVGATALGLVIHTLFPLAPPRLVRSSGLTDTLAVHGPRVYSADWSESISNQFAAMPSLHVGWAVLAAWAIVSTVRSRWRWLILVHPMVMAIAVVATGNHFVVDALVGAGVVGAVALADRYATTPRSRRRPARRGGDELVVEPTCTTVARAAPTQVAPSRSVATVSPPQLRPARPRASVPAGPSPIDGAHQGDR